MPDTLRINKKEGIIEVESSDDVSKEDILKSFDLMDEARKRYGFNRVLVDTTKQTELPSIASLIDVFSKLPPVFKSALYYKKPQITAEDIQTIETISVNRGKNLKCFHSKAAAFKWLTDD